jgi:O-acetylserine/cysteine efflux transporter
VKPLDLGLAILCAFVWGLTFIGIKYGVEAAPPFLLTALRFGFAAFPLVLFVKPPKAPARWVVVYALLIGFLQFGLLFLGVRLGMPVGLASLVIQMQVYFTILLAVVFFGERPTRAQMIGAGVALTGIALIAAARFAHASLLPFALTLAAALCWGAGNAMGKKVGKVDPIGFMAWSSLVTPLPMAALSYALEPQRTLAALLHPSLPLVLSVLGLAYGGTIFAYGSWARLLTKYPASAVSPFALLVPVVGMISARLLFGEATSATEFAGAAIVMAGLAINVAGGRLGEAYASRAWRRVRVSD